MSHFRAALCFALAAGVLTTSGCAKLLGLPDVSILQTQFPVIHYVRLPNNPKEGVQVVTWEKHRPASWVGLSEVSKAALGAIVVSEDWAFYQHKGYDPNQIKEALNKDMAKGKFARGASTITQQVAKNLFLNSEKNIMRKAKELFLAIKLEEKFKKPKILEAYLNIAEFGEDLYGIGAASNFYFNKPASELSAKEGAFLAMLLPSPKRYSQSFRAKQLTRYASKTVGDILEKMVQAQYLTEEQQVLETAKPLSFEKIGENSDKALMLDPRQAPLPEPGEQDSEDETEGVGEGMTGNSPGNK